MSPLFHFTCADHGLQGILADGLVYPGWDVNPIVRQVPWARWAWFTDLEEPLVDVLGLGRVRTSCDRTAHRFRVVDESTVVPWVVVRRLHPQIAESLETSPFVMIRHWFVSPDPVPVVLDERTP